MLWLCWIFHLWGPWSAPEEFTYARRVYAPGGMSVSMTAIGHHQRRTCERCNAVGDRTTQD